MNSTLIGRSAGGEVSTKEEIVWYVSPLSDNRIKILDIGEPNWRERIDHVEHEGKWYVLLFPENSGTYVPPGSIKVLIRQRISATKSIHSAHHAEIMEILETTSNPSTTNDEQIGA